MNGLGSLADQQQNVLNMFKVESDKLDQLKKKAEQKDQEIRAILDQVNS